MAPDARREGRDIGSSRKGEQEKGKEMDMKCGGGVWRRGKLKEEISGG